MNNQNAGFSTMAIHGANRKDIQYGALATPIYQTSTFVFDTAEQGGARFAGEEQGYIYSRIGNPTSDILADKIAMLEGGEAGVMAASGMGAISATLWTLLAAGDHVVADETLYGCTFSLLAHGLTRYGVEVTFVDTRDLEAVKKAIRPNTKVVYLETPANPNLKVIDIKALCDTVHGINKDIKVVADNTFATPYVTKPLSLGCDVVVHSVTKYLNGHGDVIAGVVVGSKEFIGQVLGFGIKDMTGAVLGPFECYLVLRGLKTLEVRMERHCANAMKVAEFLESHPMVEKVYYPGLKSNEGYEVATKQMKLYGAMISFEVKGGKEAGIKLLDAMQMCAVAVSLGDAETLIQHPASMTHATYNAQELAEAGISEGLIRLSVGLENVDDIIADLKQGLDKLGK